MRFDGTWLVEALAVGGELVPPLSGTSLTLERGDDRVGGSTGVNRFMGAIMPDPPPLFGCLATTMMAGPAEHLAQEALYLQNLASVDSLEAENGELILVSQGLVVIVLRPAETGQSTKSSDI